MKLGISHSCPAQVEPGDDYALWVRVFDHDDHSANDFMGGVKLERLASSLVDDLKQFDEARAFLLDRIPESIH